MPETHSTLEHIHIAAKKEFLEKGFRSASLRNIVKSAGVTTGALYGYYSSKEELFCRTCGRTLQIPAHKIQPVALGV